MGRLALPSLLAQAIAPSAAALLLGHESGLWILAILMTLAVFNLGLIVALRSVSSRIARAAPVHNFIR